MNERKLLLNLGCGMSFHPRTVCDESPEFRTEGQPTSSFSSLLSQVQSARVRADQMGLRSSEVALRRAVIAISKELGVPSGLEPQELLFVD